MKKNTAAILLLIAVLTVLAGCAGPRRPPRPDELHGSRGYRYFMDGDMPRAVEAYMRGYAAARGIDNAAGAARNLSNIGRAYHEMGRNDSAALYFAKAYEDFAMLGDNAGAAGAAAWLALSFAAAGEETHARKWFNTAQATINGSKRGDKGWDHYLALIRATVDFRLTSKISNESALAAAEKFYRRQPDPSSLAAIHLLIADAALAKGDCRAAAGYLNDALAGIDASQEIYKRSGALFKLATISFCAGDQRAGNYYYGRAADCAPKGTAVPPIEEVSSCGGVCR